MSKSVDKTLTEVWLLTSNPEGMRVKERVFAELGKREIGLIADAICEVVSDADIRHRIANQIETELEEGNSLISINLSSDYEPTEFILTLTDIDTGIDWNGDECVIPENIEHRNVTRGSTIYATTGWYGDVELLFSAPNDHTSVELTVE